jgi:crotonobetainyl-CoA:carnitine CoA-transferase CaiB-like acyl-CoA transferase
MVGPLHGVKVIDLSAILSGPMAAQILGDHGAEVIKVEPVVMGDITRIGGFRVDDISAMYATANRGKKSVALDLSKPAGVDALLQIAADADVLIQNFRPGAATRMGIGPDRLLELNPDLIYVSISGFGPTGPYADWKVYDAVVQSISGVVSIQQSPDIPIPDLVRTVIADKSTALTVAGAVSSALYARAMGQARGQHLEVAMIDSTLYFLWPDIFMGHTFCGDDVVPGLLVYKMVRLQQTADGHLVYFVASDAENKALFDAVGHPEWAEDERFATITARMLTENFEALGALLHKAFLDFETEDILERLHASEVPAAPINSLEDVFVDPQVAHNETIKEWEHPSVGPVKMARPPVRWGVTIPEEIWAADSLGQSTDEVLLAHGYDKETLADLRTEGVILG